MIAGLASETSSTPTATKSENFMNTVCPLALALTIALTAGTAAAANQSIAIHGIMATHLVLDGKPVRGIPVVQLDMISNSALLKLGTPSDSFYNSVTAPVTIRIDTGNGTLTGKVLTPLTAFMDPTNQMAGFVTDAGSYPLFVSAAGGASGGNSSVGQLVAGSTLAQAYNLSGGVFSCVEAPTAVVQLGSGFGIAPNVFGCAKVNQAVTLRTTIGTVKLTPSFYDTATGTLNSTQTPTNVPFPLNWGAFWTESLPAN
jgi:hypothetical protein